MITHWSGRLLEDHHLNEVMNQLLVLKKYSPDSVSFIKGALGVQNMSMKDSLEKCSLYGASLNTVQCP